MDNLSTPPSDQCRQNGPDASWPARPEFAWHLLDDFSQLKKARDAVSPELQSRVRVCHLDTGYDPDHVTSPSRINLELQRNFVEGNNDARDPGKRGLLFNPGHGTGTLGILAGNFVEIKEGGNANFADYLGGAPFSEIVPARVADSVVHLFTSSMARGIDHASQPKAGEPSCHVASISMGGLPSLAWAFAVNRAYSRGLVLVSAAGNNFGGFPMRSLVWPARFKRVLAACGVTADMSPYYRSGIHFKMQGCWGPSDAMTHAMAAFTPNIPWAELNCSATIDGDGAGTSSATPQIAAACALWLARHGSRLPADYRRVEAVRKAVFMSAFKGLPDSEKYFGNGVLKAFDALAIRPDAVRRSMTQTPEDDIVFPFFHRLEGFDNLDPIVKKMYEVEAAQLFAASLKLQDQYPDLERGVLLGYSTKDVLESFIDLPDISHALRGFLMSCAELKQ